MKGLTKVVRDVLQIVFAALEMQLRARHHIAHDVTARPERSEELFVQCARELGAGLLEDAVKLDRLAGSRVNASVCSGVEAISSRPSHWAGVRSTTWHDDSNHEDVAAEAIAGSARTPAHVAVVLGEDHP